MEETLTEIQGMYASAAPDVTLVFNFDSSGTLKTQIQEGADCDVFISAGQKQMDQLDIEADPSVNTEGLDFVLAGSRLDLLENRVTLCVPEGNPKGIENFDQLAELLAAGGVFMCMGNSDVPVGPVHAEDPRLLRPRRGRPRQRRRDNLRHKRQGGRHPD